MFFPGNDRELDGLPSWRTIHSVFQASQEPKSVCWPDFPCEWRLDQDLVCPLSCGGRGLVLDVRRIGWPFWF